MLSELSSNGFIQNESRNIYRIQYIPSHISSTKNCIKTKLECFVTY